MSPTTPRSPALRLAVGVVVGVLLATTSIPAARADVASDLKSKDVATRLAAVATLDAGEGTEGAEALLLGALGDKDFEVQEKAASALGKRGGVSSIRGLVRSALTGHVRRVRLAAAVSLGRIDPEEAAKDLLKALRGEDAVHAVEALATLARAAPDRVGDTVRKGLDRVLKSKLPDDAPLRAAAARGLAAFPVADRLGRLARLIASDVDDPKAADGFDLVSACAALDEATERPEAAYLPILLPTLGPPARDDVFERRAAAAIVAAFERVADAKERSRFAEQVGAGIGAAADPLVAGRLARLLGALASPRPAPLPKAEKPADPAKPAPEPPALPPLPPLLEPDVAIKALEPALRHAGEGARALALAALERIATPAAATRALAFEGDTSARVRSQALRTAIAIRGAGGAALDAETLAFAVRRLEADGDPSVREQAATLLGRSGPEQAPWDAPVPALSKALGDAQWTVAVVAAVSLGKTRSPAAVEPLRRLLDPKQVKDWRRRGAGVTGLGLLPVKDAVPPLIGALADKDPSVRRTAFEFLRRLTTRTIEATPEAWNAWWVRLGPTFEFVNREKAAREARQGGYAVAPEDVYRVVGTAKLDVVVLQSRGDHIEQLLDKIGIEHRITRAAAVAKAELHPFAIFVSNCTGEIQPEDVDRLQWFVRVGGYLFGSCWALDYTIARVAPGVVDRLPVKGEVLDNVAAELCPGSSAFADGVFPSFTRPIYVLYGSFLVRVLAPERAEVLIDSPACAQRWGGGNLACWFPLGHGVVLDSANHFDLQGLERVTGLKTGEDRMAYAMDHMSVDYDEVRRLEAANVWESQADSLKLAKDLSMFRFVTNFVRQKRRAAL